MPHEHRIEQDPARYALGYLKVAQDRTARIPMPWFDYPYGSHSRAVMAMDKDTLSCISEPLPGAPDLTKLVEPIFSREALHDLQRKIDDISDVLTDGDVATRAAVIGARTRQRF